MLRYGESPGRRSIAREGNRSMARPIMALIASFLVVCALGCVFIAGYWSLHPVAILVRLGVFVGIMSAVHLVGYCLLKNQPTTTLELAEVIVYPSIGKAYEASIKVAVAQQVVIILFASLLLDGGHILRLSTFGAVGSWLLTGIIVARRPRSPTRIDILIVKYGFWLAALIAMVLAAIMGRVL
jgi:hypothetical protein